MKLTDSKNGIKEIVRYGLSGMISTGTNLFLFWLFNSIGMYYVASNIFSYLLAVLLNFIFSKFFVFKTPRKKENQKFIKQGIRYFFVRIVNLIVDNLLFYFCVTIVQLPLYLTRITLTFAGILLMFAINKKWVFQNHE